ncbi:MAG: RadC family protein [Actinomycetota bacterium]
MGCRIVEVPQRDRPRERLERLGTAALTDAELVALVLRSGGPGISALGLAEGLLADSGGVSALARARLETLARIHAMGAAKASALVAAFELGRRAALGSTADPIAIRDAGDIAAAARRELTDGSREAVLVLVLNSANRLIKTQRLTVGTDTRCLLEPRDVLRAVVSSGGAAFAVAHNHPSGNPKPSPEDVACTKLLKTAADAVGVRFLDHVIVSSTSYRSVCG